MSFGMCSVNQLAILLHSLAGNCLRYSSRSCPLPSVWARRSNLRLMDALCPVEKCNPFSVNTNSGVADCRLFYEPLCFGLAAMFLPLRRFARLSCIPFGFFVALFPWCTSMFSPPGNPVFRRCIQAWPICGCVQ